MRARVCSCVHARMHACLLAVLHAYVRACVRQFARENIKEHLCVYAPYIHTYTNTIIHTHTRAEHICKRTPQTRTHTQAHTHTHTEPNLPSIVRSLCQKEPYFFRAVSQKDLAIITFVCRRGIIISRGLFLQKSHTTLMLFCKTERFSRVRCFFHTGSSLVAKEGYSLFAKEPWQCRFFLQKATYGELSFQDNLCFKRILTISGSFAKKAPPI